MIRRLDEDELARVPVRSVADTTTTTGTTRERQRARTVVEGLRDYMREQLTLDETQVEDFALALERALLLSARDLA